jgi:predicted permease
MRVSAGNLQSSLKNSGPGIREGNGQERTRSMLVVFEVALSCVLLVGAGLLLRSFLQVMDVDLGFQPSHASAIRVDYDDDGKAVRRTAVLQEMTRRVAELPGVQAVGFSDKLPLDRNRSWELRAKGKPYKENENKDAFVYIVSPGYLQAMGMHLIKGRDVSWTDSPTSPHVILINEAAARREWPGQNPIGKLALGIGDGESQVVGVLADVHETGVEENPSPEVLVPVAQGEPSGAELVVRSTLPLDVLGPNVMTALRSMNPGQPATEWRPIQQIVDRSTSPRRFFAMLVGVFAALGLILASLGIYGVISYSVTRNTQEIGIRMALGASPGRVRKEVISKTLRLALIGIGMGTIGSFAMARAIGSLLFATKPTDPLTFGGMIVVLAVVAFVAGYLPARRASKINPMIALRST